MTATSGPEMLRAIREISPRFVVGENVRGFTNWNGGMVFDQAQADLEAEGYEVLPFLLPACAVNAPHRRDRIWIVAHARFIGPEKRQEQTTGANKLHAEGTTSHAKKERGTGLSEREEQTHAIIRGDGKHGTTTDTKHLYTQDKRDGERRMGEEDKRWKAGGFEHGNIQTNWDSFPTTEPTIRSRNDGLPSELSGITVPKHRKESIMAYGNAIVPQVAFEIFKAIEKNNY